MPCISQFKRNAEQTGGGPPPTLPPDMPGDLIAGPQGDIPSSYPGAVRHPSPPGRPLPATYPGADGPRLPPRRPPPSTFPGAPGYSAGTSQGGHGSCTLPQENHPIYLIVCPLPPFNR